MTFLGLIPARGGSVRVKNKNLAPLNGRPLIEYTIKAALESHHLDRVIVSTDSEEIRSLSLRCGAEVPFLRPAEIAGKDATELDFHLHAVEWLQQHEQYSPDYIVNLYPTTPFRKATSIDQAIDLVIANKEADGLRSVVKCSEHPYKMWQRKGELLQYFVKTENDNVHTLSYHLLPEVFIQNASIYIIKTSSLLRNKSTIGSRMLFYEMDPNESVDINNPIDFDFAEFLMLRSNRSSI